MSEAPDLGDEDGVMVSKCKHALIYRTAVIIHAAIASAKTLAAR
jgi:hypothetical protein